MIKLDSDYEFYCFMKKYLPANYSIIAEPSMNYYSEWFFHYKIFRYGKLVKELKGNFLEIKKGTLIKEAHKFIHTINRNIYANR
jgi:hypothetical protein